MNNLTVIENARLVLPYGIIFDGVMLIKDGKIDSFGKNGEVAVPNEAAHIDAKGLYVGPGFVDIHVHGGGSFSTYFEPDGAARHFLLHGETTVLATPPYDLNVEEQLSAIRSAREGIKRNENIRGIYMEGPYTNPEYGANAKNNPWRHGIVKEEYEKIVDACGEDVLVWTIAPELKGIREFCEYARKVNPRVKFAIGHSEATPAEIRALGIYRPTIETHTMNATGRRPVPKGTRGVGPDEYCLSDPEIYCELISDSCGIHVDPQLQRLILRAKGTERVMLITDSTVHDDPSPPEFAHIEDLNFDAYGGLSGSKMTMDLAARNIMSHTAAGIAEAFLMASTTPARAVGLDGELGSIETGKRADLVFADDTFCVKKVMLGGVCVKE